MNGVHDMGGLQCFGGVQQDADDAAFHDHWESRIFAMTIAMGVCGKWNIDSMRSARESLPPVQYLGSSYYQIWLAALQKMSASSGLISHEELADGKSHGPGLAVVPVAASGVTAMLQRGGPSERPAAQPARFKVGDRVRTKMLNPDGHTRLPRYCRNQPGIIAMVHGTHVWPDSNAQGHGEAPTWLYNVKFNSRDLWGEQTTSRAVHVDCWEPYLTEAV